MKMGSMCERNIGNKLTRKRHGKRQLTGSWERTKKGNSEREARKEKEWVREKKCGNEREGKNGKSGEWVKEYGCG